MYEDLDVCLDSESTTHTSAFSLSEEATEESITQTKRNQV